MVNHHKMINAAIATLATCAMLLPVAGSANANESSNTAVLGAGYTATKISHPNAGLGEDDGIVNVLNGESTDDLTQGSAERGQNYSWSSVGYGDWMYVGTCYSAMGSTLKYMANTMGHQVCQHQGRFGCCVQRRAVPRQWRESQLAAQDQRQDR